MAAGPHRIDHGKEFPHRLGGFPGLALNHASGGCRGSEIGVAPPVDPPIDPPGQDLGVPDDSRERVGQFVSVVRDIVGDWSFHDLVLSYERQSI
jgi:hypothetical protein